MNGVAQIIDFKRQDVKLPERFIPVSPKRMIYASGDGMGSYNGPRDGRTNKEILPKTNIESFVERGGYNVFCCLEGDAYDQGRNLKYLKKHPELNIVVCYLTGDNERDFSILRTLFPGTLHVIDTDDVRFFPDSRTSFEMLEPGRHCMRVFTNVITGQYGDPFGVGENKHIVFRKPDAGWGPPNFTIVDKTGNVYTLEKSGDHYTELSDFSFLGEEEASHQLARQLNSEEKRFYVNTVKPGTTVQRWASWRAKNPLGGSISRTRKKRVLKRKGRRGTRK